MAKEPFLPLFVGDFLASTAEWPGEARSLYLTALAYQWVNPMRSLPADLDALRSLIGWSESTFTRWWPRVATKFETEGDRILNARLEQHRERTRELSRRRSEAGKKGAAVTNSKAAKPTNQVGNAAAVPKDEGGTAASKPNGMNGDAAAKPAALPTQNPRFAADFAAASIPSHPILSSRESASASSDVVGRARARKAASAAEDRARKLKNSIGRLPEPDPGEARRKALALLSAGMAVGDVAHALAQYGVTAEQVTAWQREEGTHAGR